MDRRRRAWRPGAFPLVLRVIAVAALAQCGGPRAPTVLDPDRTAYEGRSPEQLEEMCEGKDAGACTALGISLLESAETYKECARIRELFDRACQAGDMMACSELAVMWARGMGGPRDMGKATELFEMSCNLGDCAGCLYLAGIRGDEQDNVARGEALERACELGCGQGCEELAYHWYEGKSGPPDGAAAQILYDSLCEQTSQHPFCPDADDTYYLQPCKDQCLFDEDECTYVAAEAMDTCAFECDEHDVQAAYDKCMGSCGYKHDLAREACSANGVECQASCEASCNAHGCD